MFICLFAKYFQIVWIHFDEISGNVQNGIRNRGYYFGGAVDHHLDQGIFKGFSSL